MRGPSLSSAVVDELFRHGGQFAQMPEDGCVVRCSDNVGEGAIVLIAREVETVVEEHSCYDRHAAHQVQELVADLEIPVRISEDLPPHSLAKTSSSPWLAVRSAIASRTSPLKSSDSFMAGSSHESRTEGHYSG